jgi:hypothetical protein
MKPSTKPGAPVPKRKKPGAQALDVLERLADGHRIVWQIGDAESVWWDDDYGDNAGEVPVLAHAACLFLDERGWITEGLIPKDSVWRGQGVRLYVLTPAGLAELIQHLEDA